MRIEPLLQSEAQPAYDICTESHPNPWSFKVFQDCLTSPYRGFQLNNNQTTIGYYIALFVADEVTLMDIAVDRAHRGKGYGQKLLSHCLSIAQESYASCCWLEVRASNASAIALYQANGFDLIDTRKGYYQIQAQSDGQVVREDAFVMKRNFR